MGMYVYLLHVVLGIRFVICNILQMISLRLKLVTNN